MKMIQCLSILIFATSLLHLFSCTNQASTKDLEQLKWLEGDWKSQDDAGFSESWKIVSKRQLIGLGFTLEHTDTLMSERLEIFASDSGTYYRAKVAGQNEELPVYFKLIHLEDDSLVFSNPQHDFPRFIVYKKISNDSLRVYVRNGFGDSSKGFLLEMIKQPD